MPILKNCWEIKNCGRQKGGSKASELGVCVASAEGLGHSCWSIAGTLCGGKVQGTVAQKEKNCMACEVYRLYQRTTGSLGKEVARLCPDEEEKFTAFLKEKFRHRQ